MAGKKADLEEDGVRISLLKVELLLNGELSAEEAETLKEKLRSRDPSGVHLEKLSLSEPERGLSELLAKARQKGSQGGSTAWTRSLPGRMAPWFSSSPARAAWGLACLLLGVSLWVMRPVPIEVDESVQSKGGQAVEFQLKVNGAIPPGVEMVRAGPGDTLQFLYRAEHPLHHSVWYKEDDSPPTRMEDADDFPKNLPATSRWLPVGGRILLDGSWKRQTMWIVTSQGPLPPDLELEDILAKVTPGKQSIQVKVFSLVRD